MEQRKQQEAVDQAIGRLAQKARDLGVRLVRDDDGRYYASSVSRPGHWHYVTGVSCDCPGFASHGRCMQHPALMAALGWTGHTPEPDRVSVKAQVRCQECDGRGSTPGTVSTGPRTWAYANVMCISCHGTGVSRPAA
jgi:hypothetical protein